MLERSDFTDQYLYGRLNCCGLTSGRSGKNCWHQKVKNGFGLAVEMTV